MKLHQINVKTKFSNGNQKRKSTWMYSSLLQAKKAKHADLGSLYMALNKHLIEESKVLQGNSLKQPYNES